MSASFRIAIVLLAIGAPGAAAFEFEIRNEAEFRQLIPGAAKLEKLAGGMRFIAGPVWMPQDGGFLVFSDRFITACSSLYAITVSVTGASRR